MMKQEPEGPQRTVIPANLNYADATEMQVFSAGGTKPHQSQRVIDHLKLFKPPQCE